MSYPTKDQATPVDATGIRINSVKRLTVGQEFR